MERGEMIEFLAAKFREVLGLTGATVLDVDGDFSQYGLDSINAAKFSHALTQAFNLNIAPRVVVENCSLAQLANHLHDRVPVKGIRGANPRQGAAATDSDRKRLELVERIMLALENRWAQKKPENSAAPGGDSPAVAAPSTGDSPAVAAPSTMSSPADRQRAPDGLDFSFIFFSSASNQTSGGKYDYVTTIAQYADAHGFKAIWIPERHFFEFGGIFPDPGILLANLASTTSSIRLRSGSVVLPLHHPARIVESWSMLDNLSGGRVDMAFASGWNPNDFVLSRQTYSTLRETWFERMAQVERLWRGEAVDFYNGKQDLVSIEVYPRPLQERLAIWMAISGNPESFAEAGRRGYNVLTMLASKPVEELEANIARYRAARAEQGLDPNAGVVTLMLHTYVHDDPQRVDACVNEHYLEYIKNGLKGHIQAMDRQPSPAEVDRIVEHSFHYQRKHSALFGDVDRCRDIAMNFRRAGVNEIACLVDFGISDAQMYETLPYIAKLKNTVNEIADATVNQVPVVRQPVATPRTGSAAPIEEYAIVGLAGRYPGAGSIEVFWDNLLANRNSVSEISADRYDWREIWGDPKTEPGRTNIKHFGLLEDIHRFDASFFRISRREAEVMDPQGRLLLETAWQCVENAGYAPSALDQSPTGVFLSFYNSEYSHLLETLQIEKSSEAYLATALSGTIKANRISYLLGLRGPCETYDTACSSGLVALHRAMQSMAAGECEQALVAGVSLLLTPGRVISLSKVGILNESGVCNPFSYPARKEVIGEGVGALLIKPLHKALEANDYIYAVVCGSDVGHQGNSSGSLTMPSAEALAELMERTYTKMGLARQDVSYIEGHGSGNDSDVVELMAFEKCFASMPGDRKVGVGSVKSNIGFGEGSGGIAQITKCALSLNHGVVPATINFERADPSVDLKSSRLAIQTTNRELEVRVQPHYMSVLAYGLGGTNAHIVLRNHSLPQADKFDAAPSQLRYPMPFSAGSAVALSAYLQDLFAHLSRQSVQRNYQRLCGSANEVLHSLSRTLRARERHGAHRVLLLVSSCDDLLGGFADVMAGKVGSGIFRPAMAGSESQTAASPAPETQDRLATLWVNGAKVDWSVMDEKAGYRNLALPTVPFRGEELRLKLKVPVNSRQQELETRMQWSIEAGSTRVSVEIRADDYFVSEHVVDGAPIVPGVAYLALLSEIAQRVFKLQRCSVRNIAWLMPFSLGTAGSATMQFEFDASGHFRVFHAAGRTLCCKGQLIIDAVPQVVEADPRRIAHSLDEKSLLLDRHDYWALANGPDSKQQHGETMRRVSGLYKRDGASIAVLEGAAGFLLLPAVPILDGALAASIGIALINQEPITPAVPFSIDAFHALEPLPESDTLYAVATRRSGKLPRFDISLEDRTGRAIAVFSGYFAKSYGALPVVQTSADRPVAAPHAALDPVPSIGHAGESMRESLTAVLQSTIADFLKVDLADVPVDDGLEALGLDSIAVNELTGQLSQLLAIDLPATLMFEYTHITEMAGYLLDEYPDELAQSLGQRAETSRAIPFQSRTPAPATPVFAAPPAAQMSETARVVPSMSTNIAVVGIGGVFPGSSDVHDFWKQIKAGHDFIGEMPVARRETIYRLFAESLGSIGQLHGGFVGDAENFDAAFFELSDDEVLSMDPQQRLFLVASWQALEDAGYNPMSFAGRRIGVYVGAIVNEYEQVLAMTGFMSPSIGTGNALSGIANRASYFLDLNGPSQTIDSACCSSLYAVDRAVTDIRAGLCEAALVGGVNYIGTPYGFQSYSAMNYLAKDWRCKAFADGGDGWSKGELFAAVFLKPLDRALADNDAIYAVIKASGTNHGGRSHFYEQPNSARHLELITRVFREGQLDPRDLVHIEAHGTGTEMGDALEYNVLLRGLAGLAKERGVDLEPSSCGLGSIKSNIGHAEAAAGMAGFIKTVLLLHDKVIPPSLHITAPNKHLRLNGSPLHLTTEQRALARRAHHGNGHHASVHSFNFSGAAAHVLLAEVPDSTTASGSLDLSAYPVCVSAPSVQGLQAYLRALIGYLELAPESAMDGFVYTLNLSKSHFSHRLGFLASSIDEIRGRFADASRAIDEGRLCGDSARVAQGIEYRNLKRSTGTRVPDYARLADETVPALLERWLGESRFDWSVVLAPFDVARQHLPAYPFVRTQQYFPGAAHDASRPAAVAIAARPAAPAFATAPEGIESQPPGDRQGEASGASSEKIDTYLQATLGKLFAVSAAEIDLESPLSAYPFDSLSLVRLAENINRHYRLETTAPDYFGFVTLAEMTAFIAEQLARRPEAAVMAEPRPAEPTAPAAPVPFAAPVPRPSSRLAAAAQAAEPVAIVGVSCVMPGSADLAGFWSTLVEGRDCIREIPGNRWDWRAVFGDPTRDENKTNIKWGGFIEGVDEFDPQFFSISPREAELMDPQQRLLLTYGWKAIEDAGYSARSLSGSKTAVFVGTGNSGYGDLVAQSGIAIEGQHSTSVMPSIGPNRMSYLLNLHGPSEPIETACSSSLVAIHRAVRAMQSGDCEQALAGGIQTIITPWAHISFSKAGMLCEDGRCKTFSADANGYVRGEGVGLLFLKKLCAAERDGDHVYGLIRGSSENHGGRTNSLTAPNPRAQAELIKAAYREAKVDPRTVTYIETHGTGTPLGDPVEINGLKSAFADLYLDEGTSEVTEPHCGLGSVKSNIGHLEYAAGVAGVIKVLLQLEHQTLVKSLRCEPANPYIRLQDSPFYIVNEARPWAAAKDRSGQQLPRRAGVSSFGVGGVNAHVIVEEYRAANPVQSPAIVISPGRPALIVLSAKREDRLQEQAKLLLAHLGHHPYADVDLASIAYTLQVGRDAMDHRLAFTAVTIADLKSKLGGFLEGKVDRAEIEECYRGEVKRGKDALAAFTDDADALSLLRIWLEKGKYAKLLELWVKGMALDWGQLYVGEKPPRLSLPTYPFARERYWIEMNSHEQERGVRVERLHPLIHRNESDAFETVFVSRFSEADFFLADHRVQGAAVLPGVAQLEMARVAFSKGLRVESGICLRDVVWLRPLNMVHGQAFLEVHTRVTPLDEHSARFELYRLDEDGEAVLHSQGTAAAFNLSAPTIDLGALTAQSSPLAVEIGQIYDAYARSGIAYGPAHRGLRALRVGGDSTSPMVLATVSLPASVAQSTSDYLLHPSILDSALQATIGLGLTSPADLAAVPSKLPFALEALRIHANCPSDVWVWVRRSADSQSGGSIDKVDISVCDEAGRVCVEFSGFTSRVMDTGMVSSTAETLYYQPEWQTSPLLPPVEQPGFAHHHVVLIGALQPAALPAQVEISRVPLSGNVGTDYEAAALHLFATVRSLIQSRSPALIQVVVDSGSVGAGTLTGLSALLRTARQENPQIHGQCIHLSAGDGPERLAEVLLTGAGSLQDEVIRHVADERQVLRLTQITAPPKTARMWRDGGVYLITGGLGGLGLIVAREIAHHARGAILILTGRSTLTAKKAMQLAELNACGTTALYETVDVTDAAAVTDLVTRIVRERGGLSGVFHSAGVLADNFIVKKTEAEFRAVLAPKVGGLVNLDQATRHLAMNHFVCFSSTSSLGNAGQADYATANAFMDAYMAHRNELANRGQRSGASLAIGWPLWAEGGSRVDEAVMRQMRRAGSSPLETGEGLNALAACLNLSESSPNCSQLLVFAGERASISLELSRSLQKAPVRVKAAVPAGSAAIDASALRDAVARMLIQQVAKLLKLNAAELDLDTELTDYGFDSVSFTELGNRIGTTYAIRLTPTIFFEHPTLGGLAEHLVETEREVFAEAFQLNTPAPADSAPALTTASVPAPPRPSLALLKRPVPASQPIHDSRAEDRQREAIAIIGLSGAFPGAPDLQQFWQVLNEGRDCISEIPRDRWDWRQWFGDPEREANKSNIKWGGFIDGVAEFDPLFFGISPREALLMDPRQRLMLTHVWQALEDSGYAPSSLSGSNTAIFLGTAASGYDQLLSEAQIEVEGHTATGMCSSLGPNRISYLLNLHGPSEPVETACSSALVAIHRAIHCLRSGESDLVISGGVNTLVSPLEHVSFSKAGMLSEDGRCQTFSSSAKGYVRGEGIGILILKRLTAAELAGDHIHGVILGSAENHGGHANGLTAPNMKAQAALIVQAHVAAGIDPRTVTYIEAHGTGTALGDPVEINGLKSAFKTLYEKYPEDLRGVGAGRCGVGAVKSNIGHLELAAGVAGVIKVLLQIKHRRLVKSLHCDSLNPYIELTGSPFYVVQQGCEWQALTDRNGRELPRRAGVSSFGFGGVNAHVVIEEYQPPDSRNSSAPIASMRPALIVLSAKREDRLREQAKRLIAHLAHQAYAEDDLADIAYTLQVGRDAMEHRLAFTAATMADLRAKLGAYLQGGMEHGGIERCYRGDVQKGKETLPNFDSDDSLQQAVATWVDQGQYDKVLESWVSGLNIDWRRLQVGHGQPRRISLPTYPFLMQRFWVSPSKDVQSGTLDPGTPADGGPETGDVVTTEHSVASAAGPVAEVVPAPPVVDAEFASTYKAFELLQKQLLQRRLDAIGFVVTADGWKTTAATRPLYRQWLDESARLIRTLAGEQGQSVESEEQLWTKWRAYRDSEFKRAGLLSLVELVEATLTSMPEILTGQTAATDILFPNSSMERVENIYRNNAQADYFNEVVARTVLAAARSQTVDILEVGAGTGGTTAPVLAALKPVQQNVRTYCYTDVSNAFLIHAQRHFAPGNTFLNCRLFNVEEAAKEQGFEPGSFDVVIATNVLHATRDMRRTVGNLKSMLRPGGMLLINESTTCNVFSHLTFGLTEGWWRAEDPQLRISGGPLLSMENWQHLLSTEGFERIDWPARKEAGLGQQVIVAHSNGVVREIEAARPKPRARVQSSGARAQLQNANAGFSQEMLANLITDRIHECLSEVLNIPESQIEDHLPFREYGVDSILAGILIKSVNERCRVDLQTSVLFDYSTVDLLCHHIVAEYGAELSGTIAGVSPDARVGAVAPDGATAAAREFAADKRVAVVGISARFAKSINAEQLWKNLANGVELTEESSRWPLPKFDARGNRLCTVGGFIDGIDEFDALFFNISGAEAAYMDPQQRLFLQESWKAFEDAGYAGASVEQSRCGVYVGCTGSDYSTLFEGGENDPPQAFWGNTPSLVAARISYYLNLRGPAISIDTACSSSLSAIHMACKALNDHEIDMALAGGVFVICAPHFFRLCNRAGMISPLGHCHTFDERADGFVPGEGAGAIVLKRLGEAIAARDNIYGVILGSGMNQDGATNGITAPSAQSQELLLREVYQSSQIDPLTIQYVEAHGTGTKLGDPIEFRALTKAFRHYTDRKQTCAVGSVKTNLGHTATAAGIVGVLKVLLALKHKQIPPSLHFERGNQAIDFDDSPFYVNTQLKEWQVDEHIQRTAAVSSFGFSGTNVHMVIQEAPVLEPVEVDRPGFLLVLSARTAEQLKLQVEQFVEFAAANASANPGDISFTLLVGRRHFEHRLALVVRQLRECLDPLQKWLLKGSSSQVQVGHVLEKSRNQQASLRRFGNQCIAACSAASPVSEYLDNLSTLAHLYSQGYDLEFEGLFAGFGRMPLPTYPFAKDRYWVAERKPVAESAIDTEAPQSADASPGGGDTDLPARWGVNIVEPCWRAAEAGVPMIQADEFQHAELLADSGFQHRIIVLDLDTGDGMGQMDLHSLTSELSPHSPQLVCERLKISAVAFSDLPPGDLVQAACGEFLFKVQSLLTEFKSKAVKLQVLIADTETGRLFLCLQGLLNSVYLEAPKFQGQVILVHPELGSQELAGRLLRELPQFEVTAVRYDESQRATRHWQTLGAMAGIPKQSLWKGDGVYLVVGGLGGIGALLCESIAAQAPNATLILCGRAPIDSERQTKLERLSALGLTVDYQRCDIADRRDVQAMAAHLRSTYRRLDGLIHCAGTIKDSYLLKKTAADVEQVLSVKIKGLVNLDEATAEFALEHFIGFSSLVAVSGNPGQCDYAAANGFIDHYIQYRDQLVRRGLRSGKSLTINWPHWSHGGMRIDSATKLWLREVGIGELETQQGLDILQRCAGLDGSHYLVFAGDLTREDAVLYGASRARTGASNVVEAEVPQQPASPGVGASFSVVFTDAERNQLNIETGRQLTELFARVARLPIDRIDERESLTVYGIDSLIVTELNYQLGTIFGSLSKTLFYEHDTLADLTAHLIEEDRHACLRWTGAASGDVASCAVTVSSTVEVAAYDAAQGLPEVATNVVAPTPIPAAARADEPIAIIGLAGRYPQSRNLGELWENLKSGKDCVGEIPSNRWTLDQFFLADVDEAIKQGRSYSKWGGFLADYDAFDCAFFGISPREAQSMDPQERVFLECCWHVFEDAGYTRASLQRHHQGNVGVFVGITKTGFDLNSQAQWLHGEAAYGRTSFASAANRVSYFFNLSGPSMPIDTMCSASLTAIHEACEHLRRGECELALAGGVNLYLHPSNYIGMCSQRMLSADGRCKSFGDHGNGFVPGEGVGAVLLKPLAKAQASGDNIHGVIRASAINHGGHTHGYTVPNPNAQAELIARALQRAAIDPLQVSYVEAHGTGTVLGDPIEITGLDKAFGKEIHPNHGQFDFEDRPAQFCAIGSIKSNIGHLEAAAGIAGLTKILLQMRHRTLVPSLHTVSLNPNIDFAKTPFFVQRELAPWIRPALVVNQERREQPLIAGLSSFGAGGANAHVLVEEYRGSQRGGVGPDGGVYLLPLSANSEPQLIQLAAELLASLESSDEPDHAIADIAYTLQVGREALSERLAVIAKDRLDLRNQLAAYVAHPHTHSSVFRGSVAGHRRQAADRLSSRQVPSPDNYSALLQGWVQGEEVDWQAIYGKVQCRKVSLPLYPFERRHFPVKYDQELSLMAGQRIENPGIEFVEARSSTEGKIRLLPLGSAAAAATERRHSEATSAITDPPVTSAAGIDVRASTIDEEALRRDLVGSLERILMMDSGALAEDKNFTDMGLDSVLGVEWIQTINKKYLCDLPTTVIYDYPTLGEFSKFAVSRLSAHRTTDPQVVETKPGATSGSVPVLPEVILEQLYSGAIELETARNQLLEMNYS